MFRDSSQITAVCDRRWEVAQGEQNSMGIKSRRAKGRLTPWGEVGRKWGHVLGVLARRCSHQSFCTMRQAEYSFCRQDGETGGDLPTQLMGSHVALPDSKVHKNTTKFKCCFYEGLVGWKVRSRPGVSQAPTSSSTLVALLCIYICRLVFHMRFYLKKALRLTKSSLKPCTKYEVLPGMWMRQALEFEQGRDSRWSMQQGSEGQWLASMQSMHFLDCEEMLLAFKSGSTPA